MSNTKHLADLLKVCSILPALAIMPAMAETIIIGAGETQTLTGKHTDAIVNEGSVYFLASDDKERLAVLNIEDAIISNVTTNYANSQAGYVKGSDNSKIVVKNSEFSDNKSDWYSAIWAASPSGDNAGGILEISDSKFLRNEAKDSAAVGAMWLTNISNTLFEGNKATAVNGDGGGALLLGSESRSVLNNVVFKDNESVAHGGALAMRGTDEGDNSAADLDIIGSEFNGNVAATNGGAIYSTFYDSENVKDSVYIENTDFIANYANNGGAIYNEGAADKGNNLASMKVVDSDFVGNSAITSGGAIFNASGMTIVDSEFSKNSVMDGDGGAVRIDVVNGNKTVITDSKFTENKALGYDEADSGAISIRNGDVEISGTNFDKNEAKFGGAMYLYSGNNHYVSVDITDSEFAENTALSGGAIINIASNKNNDNGGLRLTDVKFSANTATDGNDSGGGALFLGAESQTYITRGMFANNESLATGGAISMRATDEGDNSAAKLDIIDSVFSGNIAATNGGAVYSTFYDSESAVDNVYVKSTQFVNNAAAEGGAIYNEGLADCGGNFAAMKLENVSFVDNVASIAGGAIYNEDGATVILSGDNVFRGNVAKGLANDIHNMGTLNITGGKTTFGGGVSGTGTFTLVSGAELDIGTTAIKQGAINLDGMVYASLLNDSVRGGSYGRFIGDVQIGDNAMFNLNVGAVGTYNIWDGEIVDEAKVSVGDIYEIAGIDANGITIVTRSVEDIASDTGITTQAAGAVAGLANASSGKAHQVSLALQDALNSGDVAFVEQETAKLNPTDKPVAQAAMTSVQNQVLSLTSGRMAGGGISVGRAGGDEMSQENGFWIQGLFNKSKFADAFHGYTRGVALGADTLIDNKWTIGGGLAFNNSDVHADSAHTDIDSKTLFLYGQYKPRNWYVNGTLTYNMSEYTESKNVAGVALSDTYDVDAYGAQIMTGYDFTPGITTEAGLRYLHIAQEGYGTETGARVDAMDTDFLSGVAGLKYAFAIENDWAVKLRPELRAAMTYDFISDDASATVVMPGVASYKVDGERLSRMGGEFGIGLTALYKGMEVSLMYDLDLHQDYTSQTGMIKFRGQF